MRSTKPKHRLPTDELLVSMREKTGYRRLLAARQSYRDCTLCTAQRNIGSQVCVGQGRLSQAIRGPRLLFILDRLDPEDVINPGPYPSGGTWTILEAILEELAIPTESVWVTPAALCPPVSYLELAESPENGLVAHPTDEHIKCCRQRLHLEVFLQDPDVIVCCGERAANALWMLTKPPKLALSELMLCEADVAGVFGSYVVSAVMTRSLSSLRRSLGGSTLTNPWNKLLDGVRLAWSVAKMFYETGGRGV